MLDASKEIGLEMNTEKTPSQCWVLQCPKCKYSTSLVLSNPCTCIACFKVIDQLRVMG
jgi:hypothetical protein